MITCPQCQAENSADALVCHQCGAPLAAAPQPEAAELPNWLRQLKPSAETTPAVPALAEEPADSAPPAGTAVSPSVADETWQEVATPLSVEGMVDANDAGPADDAIVYQSEPPPPPVAQTEPGDRLAAMRAPQSGVTNGSERPTGAGGGETASLITEDDLPAWLRAFSETNDAGKGDSTEDQSWMLGADTRNASASDAADLQQSWQAPTRATTHTEGAAAFATITETGPTPIRAERRMVAPASPPAPEPAPEQASIAVPTPSARPFTPRPASPPKREGLTINRVAIVAFAVALIIFLIVLGVFVVLPMMR